MQRSEGRRPLIPVTTTHLCLVSGQPIPNLVAALESVPRPRRVVLLVSERMQAEARRLVGVLGRYQIQCALWPDPAPAFDLPAMRAQVAAAVAQIKARGEIPVLNITGGTKIMTLAAHEVFRDKGHHILYVDTENGCIQDLAQPGSRRPFSGFLKITDYLAAYGLIHPTIASADRAFLEHAWQRREVTAAWAELARRLRGQLGLLNRALEPLDERCRPSNPPRGPFDVALPAPPKPVLLDLLGRLSAAGIIGWKRGARFTVPSCDHLRYLHGGWLEEYVFHCAQNIDPQDAACSVQVVWDAVGREPVRNEFDVVLLHHNRLFLIECKTGAQGRDGQRDTGIIYKLDHLKEAAGGLYARGMLVSARPITRAQQQRLDANRLRGIGPADLPHLAQHLREWIHA